MRSKVTKKIPASLDIKLHEKAVNLIFSLQQFLLPQVPRVLLANMKVNLFCKQRKCLFCDSKTIFPLWRKSISNTEAYSYRLHDKKRYSYIAGFPPPRNVAHACAMEENPVLSVSMALSRVGVMVLVRSIICSFARAESKRLQVIDARVRFLFLLPAVLLTPECDNFIWLSSVSIGNRYERCGNVAFLFFYFLWCCVDYLLHQCVGCSCDRLFCAAGSVV